VKARPSQERLVGRMPGTRESAPKTPEILGNAGKACSSRQVRPSPRDNVGSGGGPSPPGLGSNRRARGGRASADGTSPRHAWWRELFTWPGGRGCDDVDTRMVDDNCSHTGTASTSRAVLLTTKFESDHLKWARQVRSAQKEWHCAQCSLCSRGTRQRGRPHCRSPAVCGNQWPPCPTANRGWVKTLRGENVVPTDWQERKRVRLQRARGLQSLYVARVKWRQRQERERRREEMKNNHSDSQSDLEEESPDCMQDLHDESFDEFGLLPSDDKSLISVPESETADASSRRWGRSATHGGGAEGLEDGKPLSPVSLSSSRSPTGTPSESGSCTSEQRRRRKTEHSIGSSRRATQLSQSNSQSSFKNGPSSEKDLHLCHARGEASGAEGSKCSSPALATSSPGTDRTKSPLRNPDETGQALVVEEELKEHEGHGQSTGGGQEQSTAKPKRARKVSIASWEEWRTDFPLEVLDVLADFFSSSPADKEGCRLLLLADIQVVMAQSMGLPPEVIASQAVAQGLVPASARGGAQGSPSRSQLGSNDLDGRGPIALFSSLPQFLGLARACVQHMEKENLDMLLCPRDRMLIENTFRRHANRKDCITVAQLFEVIDELGYEELNCSAPEQQRWLVAVTRQCTTAGQCTPTYSGTAGGGEGDGTGRWSVKLGRMLSLNEFVHIVTSALREKQRSWRHVEFARERQARIDAGFTPWEMEDLRELYNTYKTLELPPQKWQAPAGINGGCGDEVLRLTTLLGNCGIRNLTLQERALLSRIVRGSHAGIFGHAATTGFENLVSSGSACSAGSSTCSAGGGGGSTDLVPFDVFMKWMCEIFEQGVGNLKWRGAQCLGSSATEMDLAGRRGFGAAMIRESTCVDEHRDSCSRRTSISGSRPPLAEGRQGGPASQLDGSETMPRPSSKDGPRTGRNCSGNKPQQKRLGYSSSTVGRPPGHRRSSGSTDSQGSSRRTSIGQHTAGSSRAMTPQGERGGAVSSDDSSSVFVMKGLPPSEAILSRKQFRACSVDFTNHEDRQNGDVGTPPTLLDAQSVERRMSGAHRPPVQKLPPMQPRPPEDAHGSKSLAERSVKAPQDSLSIVTDVIARLSVSADAPEGDDLDLYKDCSKSEHGAQKVPRRVGSTASG